MTALHYNDICLIPKFSNLETRGDADTSISFLGKTYRIPVIPSNMKCVIDDRLASLLSREEYFYIMHRFDIDTHMFVKNMQTDALVSISLGVNDADKNLFKKIKNDGLRVDCITIDIAHGHSKLMKDMISFIKDIDPDINIIAGNVATIEGYEDLCNWGANSIKVGIGGGSPCSTKNKTGFTLPMYSCLATIKQQKTNNIPIIADGGIREHGDIVKAIHAGADMVMIGGLFSRLIDSPAEMIENHKVYFGSASQFNKGTYKHVEGIKRVLNIETMSYLEKLSEMEQDIQSAISYSGGNNLFDIRNVKAIQVSHWES